MKQRTPLLPYYNKAVQVGRTVINFSVKPQNNQGSAHNQYSVSRLKQKIPGFQQPGESDAPRNIMIGLGVNGEIQGVSGVKVL